ncbi:MAG TPA: RHS repeat domain-containing protein [Verrucomicrobiae bacterium]|nr:RHS repeat domain-containing protein [Verrucomicrobiae bacterium]
MLLAASYPPLPKTQERGTHSFGTGNEETREGGPPAYDSLNRLNGLANSWAGSFAFGYDALSRRTSLTRPNGVSTSYSYDAVSHLLSVLHQAGGNTLDGAAYTYDAAGNRTSKTNDLNGVTSNYGYDLLYELTQVTQGGTGGPAFEPLTPPRLRVPRSCVLCKGGYDAAEVARFLRIPYAARSRKEISPQPSLIRTGPGSSSK